MTKTVLRLALRALPYLLAAVLAARLWLNGGHEPRPTPPGWLPTVTHAIHDTLIIQTAPVVVYRPMPWDKLLQTAAWHDYEARMLARISREMAEAMDNLDTGAEAVTSATVEVPGDSAQWRFGESVAGPGWTVDIPRPETYRLRLSPRALSLSIVETSRGELLAEARDLTTGRRLRVADLTVARLSPRWCWHWLAWGASAGIAARTDGGRPRLNGGLELAPLEIRRGGRSIQFLRLSVDRYRAAVDVVRLGG